MATGSERSIEFKQFDCVTDFSDHHYKDSNNGNMIDRTVKHKIAKEWDILGRHLPKSIFVRAYEGRIDLLRAAIIGAQMTPYHHGLFFFDILFPSDYPNKPPEVHYHSFGLRLNPNLYSGGFVCLSLLNTWRGKGTELWTPSTSTILQLLVSLQSLVLNERPYYNEPGIKPAWSWEVYNEDVFVLSCKTMLYLLQRPPRNFEAFIAAHFRHHASTILRACVAYKECRVCVGFFSGDNADATASKKKIKVSKKFKDSIVILYPKLFQAFRSIGAPSQNMPAELENIQEKPEDGFIFNILKSCWVSIKKQH